MRILLALDGQLRPDAVEAAAASLARVAAEHEVVVVHEAEVSVGHLLELALRNALPDRDVVGVLTQVVVDPEEPGEPHAIAGVRSLRVLVDSGALVICSAAGSAPVALDELGAMHRVEGAVDPGRTATLLARRLDASLGLMAADDDAGFRVLSPAA
jgi:carbamate kinase